MLKKSASLILALVFAFICSFGAFAANEVKASLRQDCAIFIDNKEKTLKDSKGNVLHPIKYGGTTYLPISAVKSADGKAIAWKASNNAKLSAKDIDVSLLKDYALVIDGKEKTLKDSKGNVLHPIKYNGVIYLTAKTVEEATGKTVTTDTKNKKIVIKGTTDKTANKSSEKIAGKDSYTFARNENATISITGKPNTKYSIAVHYKSGVSKADGLHSKTSDAKGDVSWTWKIGMNTAKGTYKAVITGGGETKTVEFTIK